MAVVLVLVVVNGWAPDGSPGYSKTPLPGFRKLRGACRKTYDGVVSFDEKRDAQWASIHLQAGLVIWNLPKTFGLWRQWHREIPWG